MKAYTDIEQSKKLTEILPLESADMFWLVVGDTPHVHVLTEPLSNYSHWENYPCCSLVALLSVLPTTIGNFFEKNALRLRMDKEENDFNIWYENFDCGDVAEGLDVIEYNPIDACYEMIIKLNRQKLL